MGDGAPRAIRFVRAQVNVVAGESCKAEVEVESQGVGTFTATAQGGVSEREHSR